MIDFAKSRPDPKPVMICESTPQGYDLEISQYDSREGAVSRASIGETIDGAGVLFTQGMDAAKEQFKAGTWFGNMTVEQQEQADYYDTAMAAFCNKPWFYGFCWWDWLDLIYNISEAKDNKNFCIYGKLADDILKNGISAINN